MAFFWSSLSQSFIWLLIQQERRNSRIGIIINLCIYWFLYCKDSTFFWPLFRSLIDRHSLGLFFVLRPVDRLPLSTLILWLAWKRLSGGSSFIGWLSLGHLVFWRPRFIEANQLLRFILSQELFFGSILCCELLETCPKKLIIFKTYLLLV